MECVGYRVYMCSFIRCVVFFPHVSVYDCILIRFLSINLSLHLSVSIYLSIYLSLSLYLTIFFSLSFSLSLSTLLTSNYFFLFVVISPRVSPWSMHLLHSHFCQSEIENNPLGVEQY